jgi:heat shock protein HslJ
VATRQTSLTRRETNAASICHTAILTPLCVVLLVLLSACGAPAERADLEGSGATPTRGASDPRLDGTRWRLTELNGRGSLQRSGITLEFDGGRMFGESGCNRYGVDYSAREGRLTLAEGVPRGLITTDAYCGSGLMRREDAYQRALGSAKGYRLAGDRLELLNAEGGTILAFERMEEESAALEATGTPAR